MKYGLLHIPTNNIVFTTENRCQLSYFIDVVLKTDTGYSNSYDIIVALYKVVLPALVNIKSLNDFIPEEFLILEM